MSIHISKIAREVYLAYLLYNAIEDSDLSSVKLLLTTKKANPNVILPKKKISPFHLVIGNDSEEFALEVTQMMLQHGGNPNVMDEDALTPMHIAAAWGRYDILKLLLLCGGDPEIRDTNMNTPMHYAMRENFVDCFLLLKSFVTNQLPLVCEREEGDRLKYELTLDKILVNNGNTVGEYEILNEYKATDEHAAATTEEKSNMAAATDRLQDLPQSDSKQNVMSWFNSHPQISTLHNKDTSGKNLNFSSSLLGSPSDILSKNNSINNKTATSPVEVEDVPISKKYSTTDSRLSTSLSSLERNLTIPKKFSDESGIVTLQYDQNHTVLSLSGSDRCRNIMCNDTLYITTNSQNGCQKEQTKFKQCDQQNDSKISLASDSFDKNSVAGLLDSSNRSLLNDARLGKMAAACDEPNCTHLSCASSDKSNHNVKDSCVIDRADNIDSCGNDKPNNLTLTGNSNNNNNNNNKKVETSSDYVTCSTNSSVSVNILEKNIFCEHNNMFTEDESTAAANNVVAAAAANCDEIRSVKSTCTNRTGDSCQTKSEGIGSTDLSFVSVSEVYKYVDAEEGMILYERRLLKSSLSDAGTNGSVKSCGASSKVSPRSSEVPETIEDCDSDTLRKELTLHGYNPGPITVTTKRIYLKKLKQLKKQPMVVNFDETSKRVYSAELQKTLNNFNWLKDIDTYKQLDDAIFKQFQTPDPTRRWREGVNKSSFTYLLLDPRITNNLPCRSETLKAEEVWSTFLNAIFYVGKGKRSRPYSHLYDAVTRWNRGEFESDNKKLARILSIWRDQCGVVCIHLFQNTIPVEAYTREAAMITALNTANLCNAKSGDFYGTAATWSAKAKAKFGVYLLYKAMKIFLNEGERQLCPADID